MTPRISTRGWRISTAGSVRYRRGWRRTPRGNRPPSRSLPRRSSPPRSRNRPRPRRRRPPVEGRGREGPLAEILQHAHREPPPAERPNGVQERLARQVEELTEMHAGLLASIFEAIEGLRGALSRMPRLSATEVTVSAGPFGTVEAVRAFEALLATLPGVRDVTLRGYEGEDRAVLDVELSAPR